MRIVGTMCSSRLNGVFGVNACPQDLALEAYGSSSKQLEFRAASPSFLLSSIATSEEKVIYRKYYFRSFLTGEDGPTRRSNQIEALLAGSNVTKIDFPANRWSVFRSFLRLPLSLIRYRRFGLKPNAILAIGIIDQTIRHLAGRKSRFVIEMDREMGILVALSAVMFSSRVVVLPHNIEFLVPDQKALSRFRSYRGLRETELFIFQGADKVFTISKFDSAIVESVGGIAQCLSYWPCKDDESALLGIRDKRKSRRARTYTAVCVGTIHHGPTRRGFEAYLPILAEELGSKYQVLVLGNGTEALSNKIPNVKVLGTVSSEILAEVLEEVDFAVIPVLQTSGMLTRLSDLNCAGIPILCLGDHVGVQLISDDNIKILNQRNLILSTVEAFPLVAEISARLSAGPSLY